MSATHAVGASRTHAGVTVALALPLAGGDPDPDWFFVRDGAGWRLVNIRDAAARTRLALPIQLRHPFFTHAHGDRLLAAARWLAATANAAPPVPPPPPSDAPRPWWLDL